MKNKPILVLLGEPYSVFVEIVLKTYKFNLINKKSYPPIILVGSAKLVEKQIKFFKYKLKTNIILDNEIEKIKNNKYINIIDIDLKSNDIFTKRNINSKKYLEKSFKTALKILKSGKVQGFINGPISKKKFLNKRFAGITEYLAYYTNSKNVVMLIYNKDLSVSPLTTHLPLKGVVKQISKKKIIKNVLALQKFYEKFLKIKPNIAVLGLNPHCETIDKFSEEKKIITPAISKLKLKKIKINGPYPTDTFFLKENYKKFDLVLGMYHDQVLTPIKTLFDFDAVNISIGLPFLRLSPDHGPNEKMVSKGVSNPLSFIKTIDFIKKFNED